MTTTSCPVVPAGQAVTLLPPRDTLALVNVSVTNVIGVNFAMALNAATINATATAYAWQQLGWR